VGLFFWGKKNSYGIDNYPQKLLLAVPNDSLGEVL